MISRRGFYCTCLSDQFVAVNSTAQLLGFAESPPPLLSLSNATSLISRMSTGISFASGGSGIRPETGNGPVVRPRTYICICMRALF